MLWKNFWCQTSSGFQKNWINFIFRCFDYSQKTTFGQNKHLKYIFAKFEAYVLNIFFILNIFIYVHFFVRWSLLFRFLGFKKKFLSHVQTRPILWVLWVLCTFLFNKSCLHTPSTNIYHIHGSFFQNIPLIIHSFLRVGCNQLPGVRPNQSQQPLTVATIWRNNFRKRGE